MKRPFDQITSSEANKNQGDFFDEVEKKKKLDTQRVGAFIVKANDANAV